MPIPHVLEHADGGGETATVTHARPQLSLQNLLRGAGTSSTIDPLASRYTTLPAAVTSRVPRIEPLSSLNVVRPVSEVVLDPKIEPEASRNVVVPPPEV